MTRGVGIYYDNTYPMVEYNHYQLRNLGVTWSSSILGHRDYFHRVWKRSRELMARGLTPLDPLYQKTEPGRRMRLHTVGHVTNCQVLPITTWWDATLGVEAPGHWQPAEAMTAEQRQKQLAEHGFLIMATPKKGAAGSALPYPPDYLRAMEMGRMAGLIPHYRHALRSEDAFGGLGISYGATDKPEKEILEHRHLSDKAMGMVHEIRGGANPYSHDGVRTLMDAFDNFGFGKAGVTVHNYWTAPPRLKLDNASIKWIALEKRDQTLLVLMQSYQPDACRTTLDLPRGSVMLDMFTRRLTSADQPVTFDPDYGTRLLLIAPRRDILQPLAWNEGVRLQADFELGLPPGWASRGDHAPRIVAGSADPANRVLRITPAHPSQHFVQGAVTGDGELSFRFRLPTLAGKQHIVPTDGAVQYTRRDPWRTEFHGRASAAGLDFTVKGWMEQDGLVNLDITYAPGKTPVAIQDLRIDWPIDDSHGSWLNCIGGVGGNYSPRTIDKVPAGEGTVWDTLTGIGKAGSTMLVGNWENNLWVGNEIRGLCWFGDSDEGWVPDDRTAAHSLYRDGKAVVMRNHIIHLPDGAPPFQLSGPRTINIQYNASPFRHLARGWRLTQVSAAISFTRSTPALAAGMGYRLPDGRVQPGSMDGPLREWYKRVWALMLEHDFYPGGVSGHATHSIALRALPWTDAILDSEYPIRNAVTIYPKDAMIAMSCPHTFGVNISHLGFMKPTWASMFDAGMGGSGGVFNDPGFRHFGITADDVEFLPFWRNGDLIKPDDQGVLASAWKRPGKLIIQVFNHGLDPDDNQQTRSARLKLNLKALGVPADIAPDRIRIEELVIGDNRVGERDAIFGWYQHLLDRPRWKKDQAARIRPSAAPTLSQGGVVDGVHVFYHDTRFLLITWNPDPVNAESLAPQVGGEHVAAALAWGIERATKTDGAVKTAGEGVITTSWTQPGTAMLLVENRGDKPVTADLKVDLAALGVKVDKLWTAFLLLHESAGRNREYAELSDPLPTGVAREIDRGEAAFAGWTGRLILRLQPGQKRLLFLDRY